MSKLEPKMKTITDDADDKAHIDEEAPLVLKFKHASEDHQELMVGAVLEPNQGICHQLFNDGGDGEGEAAAEEEEEEGDEKKEKTVEDILKMYPHKYISHVVRQKDIHFWRVPRLGSFMAIPLIYKSCMSEEALDEAITDWIDVQKRTAEQDAKKIEWEEEQAANKADGADAGPVEPEEPWEDIQAKPFITSEQKFVICIDTLGQDRELSDEQKRFALKTAQDFKDAWEKFEKEKVEQDRN
jgi:hypothetical protein